MNLPYRDPDTISLFDTTTHQPETHITFDLRTSEPIDMSRRDLPQTLPLSDPDLFNMFLHILLNRTEGRNEGCGVQRIRGHELLSCAFS